MSQNIFKCAIEKKAIAQNLPYSSMSYYLC